MFLCDAFLPARSHHFANAGEMMAEYVPDWENP